MKTISFYSYKGGVGRSLALTYTARYLVKRNIRVCILDIDLEAPGIVYKFPEVSDQIFSRFGVVDYINFCTKESVVPDNIEEYFSTVPQKGIKQYGYIKIMSAGKGIDTGEYWDNLSEINWKELFPRNKENKDDNEKQISEGVVIFEALKNQIEKQLNPDYLLIDSRSGVTVMSITCNSVIPDNVVMFLANNNENFYGSALMYNHISLSKEAGINKIDKVLCAITRFPESENVSYTDKRLSVLNREEDREFNTENKFLSIVKNDKLISKDISFIHSDSDVEDDEFSILHKYQNFQEKHIEQEYGNLIHKLIDEKLIQVRCTLIIKVPKYRFIKFDLQKIIEDELKKICGNMTYEEFHDKLTIDITENPSACNMLYKLALSERYNKKIVESAMYLYEAIENAKEDDTYKTHAYYLRGLMFLYDFSNYEYSIKDLDVVCNLNHSFGRYIYYHLAICCYCLGRYNDAIKYINQYLSDNCSKDKNLDSRIYLLRAVINGKKPLENDIEKIILDFNKSIDIDSEFAGTYNCKASFYENIGDNEKALENYKIAIEKDGNYEAAYFNRGLLYDKLDEITKALDDYNKAIEINEEYEVVYRKRGLLYAKLGKTKDALDNYNKAIEINDEFYLAYYDRGLLYVKLGEREKALDDFNKIPENSSNYEEAKKAREEIMIRITPISYYKRLEIEFQLHDLYYNIDFQIENVDIEQFPVKYYITKEYFEFAIKKDGDRLFLLDQGRTLKMLKELFYIEEFSVAKNIVNILKEFRVLKNKSDLFIEMRNTENNDNKTIDEIAKYRLFRCISFINKMHLFYIRTNDAITCKNCDKIRYKLPKLDNPSTNKNLLCIKELYPFPINYFKSNVEYEFVLIKKDNQFYLSDQGKTHEMLDKMFKLEEIDVQKYLCIIMNECKVLQNEDEFLIEINSPDDKTEIEEAKYRLLECVSFMDTMRIFYK